MHRPYRRAARLTVLVWLCTTPALAADPQDGTVSFEPIAFKLRDGTVLSAERGTFYVPENRRDPGSRRIAIRFVRFKSTSANPGAPIVYLAGGPGGSGIDTARGPRHPVFLALRAVADVIALDQRGTGLSNAIPPCTAPKPVDLAQTLNEATYTAYYRQTLAHCVGFWRAAGVSINGYTTQESAEDIEALRRGLMAPKLDLWGISYGTHLALATMRSHPKSIGRAALASVEGMDQTVKLPAHLDLAMARIAAAGGDPGLVDTIRRVHAKFDAEPQTATVTGADGAGTTFRMDSFPLRMFAGFLPKNPEGIKDLARFYGGLDAGGFDQIAPLIHQQLLASPLTMRGMSEAMDIASGITDAKLRLVDSQAPKSLLGRATNAPMPQLRGAIPGIDLGDTFRREVRSAIPTLVISGDLDIRTPLEEQAQATAGLTRKSVVLVRNGGHDLYEAHPDMAALLSGFFRGEPVTTTDLILPAPKR